MNIQHSPLLQVCLSECSDVYIKLIVLHLLDMQTIMTLTSALLLMKQKTERERERTDRKTDRQTERQSGKEGERLFQAAHMILVILP